MVSYLWCHTYGVYVAAKASSLRVPMARHERALTLTHMAPNDSVCVLPVVAFGRTPHACRVFCVTVLRFVRVLHCGLTIIAVETICGGGCACRSTRVRLLASAIAELSRVRASVFADGLRAPGDSVRVTWECDCATASSRRPLYEYSLQ